MNIDPRAKIPYMPTRPKTRQPHATAKTARRRGQVSPVHEPCCASRKLLREIARIIYDETSLQTVLHFPDPQTITRIHANGYRRIVRLMGDPTQYA